LIGTAPSWHAYLVGFLPGTHAPLAALPGLSGPKAGFDLILWDVDSRAMSRVAHLESGWRATDISPDGKWVSLSGQGGVVLLPLPQAAR
jgi:hypothetical protein